MKTLFILAESNFEIDKKNILEISKKLPKQITICYSSQYFNQAKEIKEILSKEHKITKFSQVLGCSKPIFEKNTKAILLISDGKFHAVSLALESNLPVYLFSGNKLTLISDEEIKKLQKKKKVSLMKFLNSKKVGILVSTKPGQEKLKQAIKLKQKLNEKDSYLFLSNNIDTNEFENFSSIESWVNTTCPRMDINNGKIVNFKDLDFSNTKDRS